MSKNRPSGTAGAIVYDVAGPPVLVIVYRAVVVETPTLKTVLEGLIEMIGFEETKTVCCTLGAAA